MFHLFQGLQGVNGFVLLLLLLPVTVQAVISLLYLLAEYLNRYRDGKGVS